MSKPDRILLAKGIIGGMAAFVSILSYIAYYFCFYRGIPFDELYFISTGYSIAIFTGLLFTFFKKKITRTLLLFCSTFYSILVTVYIVHWVCTGLPYAYIKISLFLGLLIGIIYFCYDVVHDLYSKH